MFGRLQSCAHSELLLDDLEGYRSAAASKNTITPILDKKDAIIAYHVAYPSKIGTVVRVLENGNRLSCTWHSGTSCQCTGPVKLFRENGANPRLEAATAGDAGEQARAASEEIKKILSGDLCFYQDFLIIFQ